MANHCYSSLTIKGKKKDIMSFAANEISSSDGITFPEVEEDADNTYHDYTPNWVDCLSFKVETNKINLSLSSSWNPPVSQVRILSKKHPELSFKLIYWEFGNYFSGVFEIKDGETIFEEEVCCLKHCPDSEYPGDGVYIDTSDFNKLVNLISRCKITISPHDKYAQIKLKHEKSHKLGWNTLTFKADEEGDGVVLVKLKGNDGDFYSVSFSLDAFQFKELLLQIPKPVLKKISKFSEIKDIINDNVLHLLF